MKIYEKAYYTRDGYYCSEYSKTYNSILKKHLDATHPEIVTEVIIKDVECPAEDVPYQTSILLCNVRWLMKDPISTISDDHIEILDRIEFENESEWLRRI